MRKLPTPMLHSLPWPETQNKFHSITKATTRTTRFKTDSTQAQATTKATQAQATMRFKTEQEQWDLNHRL